jgi:anionic cell wall polymer biosynthesis LytR-Cps2A-Psr (LCP) family protein
MRPHNVRFLGTSLLNWILRGGLLLTILVISCIAGLLAYGAVRQFTINNLNSVSLSEPNLTNSQKNTQSAAGTPVEDQSNPVAPSIEPTLTPWDGVGRVTILLLGLDYRDWEAGNEYSRSDTMILLTLDPLSKTAGILSIPRDMWVAIPGFQHEKINVAYYLGDAYKLPGGGPGLAVKTVEDFLGVPINYYAQIDFGAFVKFIDELGGI